MPYDYTDPERETNPYALPDVELFHISATGTPWEDSEGNTLEAGWYYAFGFPGCLHDSEPYGPYDTAAAALASARAHAGIDVDDDSEAANG